MASLMSDPQPAAGSPASRRLTRRRFLLGLGGGALACAGAGVDAYFIEPRWLRVTQPVVTIPHLPAEWDGLRIAVWADIHWNHMIDAALLTEAAALTRRHRPDLIVYVGDIINRHAPADELLAVLRTLRAPLGALAVMGNHDHYDMLIPSLRTIGVRTLVNAHALLERDGSALAVAGADDLWRGRPDLAKALAGVPQAVPRIVLCHNPDLAEEIGPDPRVDLMLCGHTHGGQIRLPLIGALQTATAHRKHTWGLSQGPHCPVYTTAGLGMGIVPLRFLCRPEVAIVTLRRPAT